LEENRIMSKQDVYPRSTPFRPTEVNGRAAPSAQPFYRKQWVMMAGFCILFLGAGLTLGLLMTNRNSAKNNQPADEKPIAPALRPNVELEDSLQLVQREQSKGTTGQLQLPIPEAKEAAPKSEGGLPGMGGKMTSQPGNPVAIPETVVEALGGLTASHLYQTYLNIGLLADSVEGEVYEKDEARKLLDTVAGLMSAVEQQLDRLGRQTLKGDERKAVEQARLVTNSLRTQTRELMAYWEKNEKENVTRFHQARQDSWNSIKVLLNIQE
jgi:hypothetical protein